MNPRLVMSSAAVLLVVAGLALLFAPVEILRAIDASVTGPALPLLVQILGAAYLGMAALNWLGRGALLGGIYGRPVTLGNFWHFFVGASVLLRAARLFPGKIVFWIILAVYALLAAAFGRLLFFASPTDS